MMADEEDYKSKPTDEKIQHKLWKARVDGYTELQKLADIEDNPKNPALTKYVGLLKKIVTDSNAIAQEKGLEAVFSFVTNVNVPQKVVGEIINALVNKCFNSTRQKTKDLALEIVLMMVELENQAVVIEELLAGSKNKQPKIQITSIQGLRSGLHLFGPKIIPIGPLIKEFERLLEDRDKVVRDESKQLIIEIYRWIGAALKPQLSALKPVQVAELESEFENITLGSAKPERFIRSEQAKREKEAIAKQDAGQVDEVDVAQTNEVAFDPLEFIDPVDILSQIPKEFWEGVESPKWQERQGALEILEKLVNVPKLKAGDYSNLMRILINIINKDTNVMLATKAAQLTTILGKGLNKGFQPYAMAVYRACLAKFKEKKPALVIVLRECIDLAYTQLTLEAIAEETLACLTNKNPCIRSEAALLLCRCCRKCPPGLTILNKKILKQLIVPLAATMADNSPEVREAVYECLGILMLKVGNTVFMAFLGEIDGIKMKKIEEYFEKEKENVPSSAATTKKAPNATPAAASSAKPATTSAAQNKTESSRPNTAPASKAVTKPGGGGGAAGRPGTAKPGGKTAVKRPQIPVDPNAEIIETHLSEEAVEMKVVDLFGEECLKRMTDPNWKERLSAMETVDRVTKTLSDNDLPCQVIVKFLAMGKSGLKDSNLQVLKMKIEMIRHLAENGKFSKTSADICLPDIIDKIGDIKSGDLSKAALTAIAEECSLEYVGLQLMQIVFKSKNLKNQAEGLNWIAQAVREFGLKISVKELLKYIRLGFASTTPAVRQAAIGLTVSLYLYMGDTLRQLLDDEKPALLALIDAEIGKIQDQKPPAPTRGLKKGKAGGADGGGGGADGKEDDDNDGSEAEEVTDLIPRVNIRNKLSDNVFEMLGSKNWKERNEGLEKIQSALNECKFVSGDMSEIFSALFRTCADANKILVKLSLTLCESLCKAMTKKACGEYCKTLIGAYMNPLGDNKPQIRAAALSALDTLVAQCGLTAILETETITESLKQENPFLCAELCGWLNKSLTAFADSKPTKAKFFALVRVLKPALTNFFPRLEDRNSEVRKTSQEALLPLMRCLGYEFLVKTGTKVCPNSKVIRQYLDKTKDSLPAVPMVLAQETVVENTPASIDEQQSAGGDMKKKVDAKGGANKNATSAGESDATSSKKVVLKRASTSKPSGNAPQSKKKEEDVPLQAILSENNAKEQRFTDEKKRKLLKWDFDAPLKDHHAQLTTLFQPNCSTELHNLLFSTDFKQHIKAIDILQKFLESDDELSNGIPATKANLDLILKWMVLRFFETNPAVIMRELTYLNKVFSELSRTSYVLHEFEATSFLPYVINKLGDSKDNIRKDVRSLLVLLRQIYPVSKQFPYLMEGLRSKVSRQRQECLEELGNIIACFNINICQPSPAQALKVIAQQISDRDSGVRTAALNALVEVYNIVGDQVFKLAGNLNEKDRSMLEERIKRVGNYRGFVADKVQEPNENEPPSSNTTRPPPRKSSAAIVEDVTTPMIDQRMNNLDLPPAFRLDFDDSDLIESRLRLQRPLNLHDVEPLFNEIMKPYERPAIKTQLKAPSLQAIRQSVDATSAIGMVITQITSKDISVSMDALSQIDRVLQHDDIRELMLDHVDQLVLAITMQFKAAPGKYTENNGGTTQDDSLKLSRALLAILISVFSQPVLSRELSRDRLKELLHTLFILMLDERIVNQAAAERFIQSINVMVTKILENSNKTASLTALLRLLFDCVESGNYGSKLIQLVMKCLWRITRSLRVPGAVQEYQLDAVLYECHLFFKAFPCASWKNRKPDVPIRTVKTFLHSLCQHQGESILIYTKNIPQREETELYSYLLRTLKTSKAISSLPSTSELGQETAPTQTDRNGHVTSSGGKGDDRDESFNFYNSEESKLRMIFKQVNSGEHIEQAIEELFDFKEANPDADLSPYMNMNKPFFTKFIELSLRRVSIERQRLSIRSKTKSEIQASSHSVPLTFNSINEAGSAPYFMERLEQIKKHYNFHVPSSTTYAQRLNASSHPLHDHPMVDSTYQNSMLISTMSPNVGGVGGGGIIETSNLDVSWLNEHNKDGKGSLLSDAPPAPRSTFTSAEISDLKRRLEKIKNENK